MKRIFILNVLALCLISLSAPQAAAQKRGPVASGPAKVDSKIPTHLKDLAVETGTQPKILGTSGSSVYSVNPSNGASTHISVPKYLSGMSMEFVGFAQAGNTLYGLTSASQSNQTYRSSIFSIGPEQGSNRYGTLNNWSALTLNGNRVYCIGEGDLAHDRSGKSGGLLYATCQNGGWKLLAINPNSGVAVVKGTLLPANGIFSALAFNLAGDLYALDTHNRKLLRLDKNSATVLQTIPLTGTLPNTSTQGAMGFSDIGGLYAAFGGAFVSINPADGAVGIIRPTNYGYISGLAVWGGSHPVKHQ